jgi:hypothetical protein
VIIKEERIVATEKHPLDILAEQMEAAADRPVAAQEESPDYWELRAATDETVGDYPQAIIPGDEPYDWGESEGLGPDGFPNISLPEQELQSAARWTDVLSSSLWSDGLLFNENALAVFKQCDLGAVREYPAVVRDQTGAARTLTYLHFQNKLEPTAIDFERSEFYLADMLGTPTGRPVVLHSVDDWQEKRRRATEGQLDGCRKFSGIKYKKLYFRTGHRPSVDYFTLPMGITVYISARLRDAIVRSGISGLEIKPNKRLYADL